MLIQGIIWTVFCLGAIYAIFCLRKVFKYDYFQEGKSTKDKCRCAAAPPSVPHSAPSSSAALATPLARFAAPRAWIRTVVAAPLRTSSWIGACCK